MHSANLLHPFSASQYRPRDEHQSPTTSQAAGKMALPGSVGPNTHIFNFKSKNEGSRKMINTLNIDKRLWKTKAMKMTEYTDTGTSERAFTVKCWRQKSDRKGVKEQEI